jgi:hypothetical protein
MAAQANSLRQLSKDENESAILEIYKDRGFEGDVDERSVMIAFQNSTALPTRILGRPAVILFARPWAGVVGMVCTALLVICLFLCCFVPTGDSGVWL